MFIRLTTTAGRVLLTKSNCIDTVCSMVYGSDVKLQDGTLEPVRQSPSEVLALIREEEKRHESR